MVHFAREQNLTLESLLHDGIGRDVRPQGLQRIVLALQMLIGDLVHFAHTSACQELNDHEPASQPVTTPQLRAGSGRRP